MSKSHDYFLTFHDRAEAYNETWAKKYPASRIHVQGGWLIGVWQGGHDYKNRAVLYGTYPPRLLDRLMSLFPDIAPKDTLHVFAGAVPKHYGLRVDINPALKPDIVANAEHLSRHLKRKFKLVVADPPYGPAQAKHYGTSMPNRRLVLREIAKVTEPDGFLAWLDVMVPMYRKKEWNYIGQIYYSRSVNQNVRLWSLFRRVR
jgi:hypothetical protein